jgi:hypothetical protein
MVVDAFRDEHGIDSAVVGVELEGESKLGSVVRVPWRGGTMVSVFLAE